MRTIRIFGKKVKIPKSMRKMLRGAPKLPKLSWKTKMQLKKGMKKGVKLAEMGVEATETQVKSLLKNLPKANKMLKKKGKTMIRASKKIANTKLRDLSKGDLDSLMNMVER